MKHAKHEPQRAHNFKSHVQRVIKKHPKHAILRSTPSTSFYEPHQAHNFKKARKARKHAKFIEHASKERVKHASVSSLTSSVSL